MKAGRTVGEAFAALLAGGTGVGTRSLGYRVAHFAPARVTRRGVEKYETPVRGDGKGFPDLVLAKATADGPRVLLIELKAEAGVLSEHQRAWAEAAGVLVFRPSQWESIVATLAPPAAG
jgi:hypothetical protein